MRTLQPKKLMRRCLRLARTAATRSRQPLLSTRAPALLASHALPAAAAAPLLRRRCSSAALPDGPPQPAPTRQNLFEVARELPKYGVGSKVFRSGWTRNGYDPNEHHWQITRVELWTKGDEEQFQRGKAWGVLTWKGVTEAGERRVRTPLKKEWVHLCDAQAGRANSAS